MAATLVGPWHPNVLAVGGTTLRSVVGVGLSATVVESGWVGSGGGSDPYYAAHTAQRSAFGHLGLRRMSPDLAAVADPRTGVQVWCTDYFKKRTAPVAVAVGGTSLAAPVVSALLATANGLRISRGVSTLTQDQVMGTIYGRGFNVPGRDASADPLFRDTVRTGVGKDVLSKSVCVPGFDLVTGRGSPLPTLLLALSDIV